MLRACCKLVVLVFFGLAGAVRPEKDKKVPIMGGAKATADSDLSQDQAAMKEFLVKLGFEKYTTKEYMEMWDEEVAADSVYDLTSLMDDEEYTSMKEMTLEEARKIAIGARRTIVGEMFDSMELEEGDRAKLKSITMKLVQSESVDWELDDVTELDDDEAESLGLSAEQNDMLAEAGERFVAFMLLSRFLRSFELPDGSKGPNSWVDRADDKAFIDCLYEGGVEDLTDLAHARLSDFKGDCVTADQLEELQAEPRIQHMMNKSEL